MENEPRPEREPLKFPLDEEVSSDLHDVRAHIQETAERLLYHWKSFPIVLPPSIVDKQTVDENGKLRPLVSFKDLFISPTFDELHEVAVDEDGNSKVLNSVQLQTVRTHGEFDVSSKNFPGQQHRWRLTQLLQKGTAKSRETFMNDMALSLKLLIITARNRLVSNFFSLSHSVTSLFKAGCQFLDILIGLPGIGHVDLESRLHEEHMKYLVAELDVQGSQRSELGEFCDYVKQKVRELDSLRHTTVEFKTPLPPYRLQTPKGQAIDLRLFNRELMGRLTVVLKKILEKESEGWYIKFKDRLVAEMEAEDEDDQLTTAAISEHVNRCIRDEYLRRVFDAVLKSSDVEAICTGIGQILVEQAKSCIVMNGAVTDVRDKLTSHSNELKNHLISKYPVRYRIDAWMNEKLSGFRTEFISLHQWTAHEDAIEQCRQQGLTQTEYFLHRDLTYFRDREPVLKEELSKVRRGTRTFTFSQRIWFPGNWVVKRILYGETEIIPTVIVEGARDYAAKPHRDFDTPTFVVEKDIYRKTSTKFPFWRWINYFMRTWTWTWNAMFWFGVAVPWCSPVSFRALCYRRPFIPALDLNPNNGTLSPKLSSKTQTLRSRLSNLWQHVRDSRAKFEAEPDTGFLGKSFVRHLNRAWNYVIKGALGSVGLIVGFAPVCVLASSFSILVAILSPLWMPFVTLFVHLFFVTIYDFDNPGEGNALLYLFEAVIWRFLILGLLQPVCALLTAGIVLPLTSAAIMLFSLLRRSGRELWDLLMFHAVIKKRARIPAKDSFIVRRIAGPGLASNYFYQVKSEQVLAAVEAQMELEELQVWEKNLRAQAQKPRQQYEDFVKELFRPFSADLVHHGNYVDGELNTIRPYTQLAREIDQIIQDISDQASTRRQALYTGLTTHLRDHIKLQSHDLQRTITQTAELLQEFYPTHVFARMRGGEGEFWEKRQLERGNWKDLAKQILGEVFTPAFLTPIEDTDRVFRLEIQHLNLGRYVDMLSTASVHDDLDVVEEVHTPKGDIDVEAPYFDVQKFSPVKSDTEYAEFLSSRRKRRRWPWKPRQTLYETDLQKLQIPLPILHPATIVVYIHNRDNDSDPIDVDDPLCQRILRAAESTVYTDLPLLTHVDPAEESSSPDHTSHSGTPGHLAQPEVLSDYTIHTSHSGEGSGEGQRGREGGGFLSDHNTQSGHSEEGSQGDERLGDQGLEGRGIGVESNVNMDSNGESSTVSREDAGIRSRGLLGTEIGHVGDSEGIVGSFCGDVLSAAETINRDEVSITMDNDGPLLSPREVQLNNLLDNLKQFGNNVDPSKESDLTGRVTDLSAGKDKNGVNTEGLDVGSGISQDVAASADLKRSSFKAPLASEEVEVSISMESSSAGSDSPANVAVGADRTTAVTYQGPEEDTSCAESGEASCVVDVEGETHVVETGKRGLSLQTQKSDAQDVRELEPLNRDKYSL